MAEFCLDCFNELNHTHYKPYQVTLCTDFCEGCGQIKPCVVLLQPPHFVDRLTDFLKGKKYE